MRCTYSIVTPLYLVLGCLGYYAYGGHAHANLECPAGDPLDDRDHLLVAQHVPHAVTADHEEFVLMSVA